MTNINLLPWRFAEREAIKKQFLIILSFSILLTIIILFFIHFIVEYKINHYKNKNHLFKIQISHLDKKIDEIKSIKKQEKQILYQIKNTRILQQHNSETQKTERHGTYEKN